MTDRRHWAAALACAMALLVLGRSALAGSEEEKKKLYKCASDVCAIIVSKNPKGPDLTCDVTKTWDKEQIQKGANSKHISWGLGAATCHVKFQFKRADIIAAMTAPKATFKPGKQYVACEVGEDKYPIRATLTPELEFKGGNVAGASLGIHNIEGAVLIKGAVWTAARLEGNFGIFEKDLVREVNRFVHKECPKWVVPAK